MVKVSAVVCGINKIYIIKAKQIAKNLFKF